MRKTNYLLLPPLMILLFLSGANAFIKKLTLGEFDLILKVQAVEEVICNAQESFSSKANSNNSDNLIFLQGKKTVITHLRGSR